jgi:hypothetical protein
VSSPAAASGANPPRKVAEYTSVADYQAALGKSVPHDAVSLFQPGDKLLVLEANGVQWTELWRGGVKVATY